MKKIISSLLLLTAALGSFSVQAQTADEIVNKHVEAIGGKDKIKQVQSLYMEGTMQVMGNESPTKITLLAGKGYKTETDFNGQKMVQCVTDKGGWAINPMNGGSAEAMPEEQYKAGIEQLDPGGALYDYAAKGSTVELVKKDNKEYILKLVTKDKVTSTYFVDAATFLLSKMVRKANVMGQEVEMTVQLSDYKKTDIGFLIPFAINTDLGQFQLSTTITKAAVNQAVDPAIFTMPK
jgi:hypothetical protein